MCEGGYAMPARPDDGEFVWKVFERSAEKDDDDPTGESLQAPQSAGRPASRRKVSVKADNRYVVPYNPRLLLEFDSHINVEMCGTVRAVKYIFKYVFKVGALDGRRCW